MSGHNRASDLGQVQKGITFDGRFLHFSNGVPSVSVKGFGKGALGIDTSTGTLYINNGTMESPNWASMSSSFVSDPEGALPLIAGNGQKANVMFFGDSFHTLTQDTSTSDSGLTGMISGYVRAWRPKKWSGCEAVITTGNRGNTGTSGVSGGPLTNSQLITTPGGDSFGPSAAEFAFNYCGAAAYYTVTGSPAATYAAGSSDHRLFQPKPSINPNTGSQISTRIANGVMFIGTEQNFVTQDPIPLVSSSDYYGTQTSTVWYNDFTGGTIRPITYRNTYYNPSSGGVSTVNLRARHWSSSTNYDADAQALAAGGFTTIDLSPAASGGDDYLWDGANGFGIDARAGSTGTVMHCWSRIFNPAVTDGLSICAVADGSLEIGNHAYDSTQQASAPLVAGNRVVYSNAALQKKMEDFDINIAIICIINSSNLSRDLAELELWVNRVRAVHAASSVAANGLKVVLMTAYPSGTVDGAGEARAAALMKTASQLGISYIDAYGKCVADGITETTASRPNGDTVHFDAVGAQAAAESVWNVISPYGA